MKIRPVVLNDRAGFAFLYSLVYVKDLFSGVKVQWISRVIALREWDFNAFWFTERSGFGESYTTTVVPIGTVLNSQ